MNCEEFRRDWTEWHEGGEACDGDAMLLHRDTCPHCFRYDQEMRQLLAALANLPPPEPAAERHGAPRHAHVRARWPALAATLVIGIALGLLIGIRSGGDDIVAEPVQLAEQGRQRIAVAFDSPRALDDVEFVVELPEGVELAGFPGQRTVRWQGRLAAGPSRLQLPLRVEPGADGGRLVTRIVHDGRERRLVVPLVAANAEMST